MSRKDDRYVGDFGSSYGRKPRFYRRFEFWIIVVAVAIATILLGLGGCAPIEPPEVLAGPPEPANARVYPLISRTGRVASVRVLEFSDSAGRLCVALIGGSSPVRSVALDCTSLPPIAIERLPE
jgi:hypothetical protein